jgi:RNAse (barnase) inhibitor barstar
MLIRRRVAFREPRNTILIVCEGEKTEPNYFNKFPVKKELVRIDVEGTGCNTVSLVKRCIEMMEKAEKEGHPYNQAWCVFDRDIFPLRCFNDALQLAKHKKIKIAYSNEAFELWYLLHFNYYNTAMSRHQYCEKLSELLPFSYVKNLDSMYDILKRKQAVAIKYAKKLFDSYNKQDPANNNPSTTIFLLVEELNRFK